VALNSLWLTNDLFLSVINCTSLTKLALGGKETEFNYNLSLEGVELLAQGTLELEKIYFEYCGKLGDLAIDALC
jgi:hypothetical protein